MLASARDHADIVLSSATTFLPFHLYSCKYNFGEVRMLFYEVHVQQVLIARLFDDATATCHQPGIADSTNGEDISNKLTLSESSGEQGDV